MQKKIMAFVSAALLAGALSACGGASQSAEATTTPTEDKAATPEGGANPCGGEAAPEGGANPCGGEATPEGGE